MAAMSLLVCGVALAALPEIVGTARDNNIRGTEKAERASRPSRATTTSTPGAGPTWS